MHVRFWARTALVAVLGLGACDGGGGQAAVATFPCADPKSLCLQSCSLGCSVTGCQRTTMAQNEQIVLVFSQPLDPLSVDSSTIRLRSPSGDQPVGEFLVNGSIVEFVPGMVVTGGQTFFGFQPGETYTLTLPGGADATRTLRSTAGGRLQETLTCTLVASEGIRDYNNGPPSATLVRPTESQVAAAPLDTLIQVEFDELIDVTPFQGAERPVGFNVRRTRVGTGGLRECINESQPTPIAGTQDLVFVPSRGRSVLTFRPAVPLPPNVCIEVAITNRVVDLSGRGARPQVFSFLTVTVPLEDRQIVEEFDNADKLDRDASGGSWSGGEATFAPIGGDARHGAFNLDYPTFATSRGNVNGRREYAIDTDTARIPSHDPVTDEPVTTTGAPITVSDGRFFFSSMVVPSDVRLVFTGSNPPQFTVSGKLDVLGEIDIQGRTPAGSLPTAAPPLTPGQGQIGGVAGIFGGRGGRGGNQCNGTTPAAAANQGENGVDANILGARGYQSSRVGSGGRGSTVFPADGLTTSLVSFFPTTGALRYCAASSAGGAGGGLRDAGGPGLSISNNLGAPLGPAAAAGTPVQFFPFPPPTGSPLASVHFLVGGSGGGGAASNASIGLMLASTTPPQFINSWCAGGGGGGGGGAMSLRAGDSLLLASAARVLANGGAALANTTAPAGAAQAATGGGGSGGSVVLQSGREAIVQSLLDVRGGLGGPFSKSIGGTTVTLSGGDGSAGFVRLETVGGATTSMLPGMQPAPTPNNVGTLTETDTLVSFRSQFYSTNLVLGPEFARYEIYATVDGVPVVFSDDPAVSPLLAGPGQPIRTLFQAANVDTSTGDISDVRDWVPGVASTSIQSGIAADGLNAFRYMLIFDRTFAQTVTIQRLVVVYRV